MNTRDEILRMVNVIGGGFTAGAGYVTAIFLFRNSAPLFGTLIMIMSVIAVLLAMVVFWLRVPNPESDGDLNQD